MFKESGGYYCKLIRGRAAAGSTVFVRAMGKMYRTVSNQRKIWKVRLSKRLKKGKVIKTYVASGDRRSKVRRVKVR